MTDSLVPLASRVKNPAYGPDQPVAWIRTIWIYGCATPIQGDCGRAAQNDRGIDTARSRLYVIWFHTLDFVDLCIARF